MTKMLLRSGSPDDLFWQGEAGHRVFDYAYQLREILRMRRLDKILALLAIPKPNASGHRVDWYAPTSGTVTHWTNASAAERDSALRYITDCHQQIMENRESWLNQTDSNARLVGALFSKLLCYPSNQYIYFVDEQPILTFWGFSRDQQPHCPIIHSESTIQAEAECSSAPSLMPPSSVEISKVLAQTDCRLESPPAPSKKKRYLLSVILGTSLLVTAAGYYHPILSAQAHRPRPVAKPSRLNNQVQEIKPVSLATTLPLENATELASVMLQTAIEMPVVPGSILSNLSIPPRALKRGSTEFLTGVWQSEALEPQPVNQPSFNLTYTLDGHTGLIEILTSERGICRAKALSGWLPSGTLRIKPSSEVRCTRGGNGTLPTTLCSRNSQGETVCQAHYPYGKSVAVRLVQVTQ